MRAGPAVGIRGHHGMLIARHSGKVLIMRSEALADRTPLIQVTNGGPGSDPLHSTAWQFR